MQPTILPAQIPAPVAATLRQLGAVINPLATEPLYAPLHPREPYDNATVTRDQAFGSHPLQRLDVFAPAPPAAATGPAAAPPPAPAAPAGDPHLRLPLPPPATAALRPPSPPPAPPPRLLSFLSAGEQRHRSSGRPEHHDPDPDLGSPVDFLVPLKFPKSLIFYCMCTCS